MTEGGLVWDEISTTWDSIDAIWEEGSGGGEDKLEKGAAREGRSGELACSTPPMAQCGNTLFDWGGFKDEFDGFGGFAGVVFVAAGGADGSTKIVGEVRQVVIGEVYEAVDAAGFEGL